MCISWTNFNGETKRKLIFCTVLDKVNNYFIRNLTHSDQRGYETQANGKHFNGETKGM